MITIFCFSYAGGVATEIYAGWGDLLGPDFHIVPVDYPGRGSRANEAQAASSLDLIKDAVGFVEPHLYQGAQWSVFGHSMGAMVAYEVARLLGGDQLQAKLLAVFLSGRRPPGDGPLAHLSSLDDESLARSAAAWGGIPPEFLAHPHLRPLIACTLRADLELSEHPGLDLPLLACPVRVLSGTDDPLVDVSQLPRWAALTTEPIGIHLFDGNHFYFRNVVDGVVRVIKETLALDVAGARDELTATLA